jgi:hypothetical protein
MTSRWLTHALLPLLILPIAACFSPNDEFCDSDEQCAESQSCNLERQTCQALPAQAAEPDAGAGTGEQETACGESCVAAAPIGWNGPVARSVGAEGEAPSDCGDVFSVDLGLASTEIIQEGSCGCSCGDAAGLSCSPAFLKEWESSEASCELKQCDVIGGDCVESVQTVPLNSCLEISFVMRDFPILTANFGHFVGGSCGAPTANGELSSHLGAQTRLCKIPEVSEDCGEDGVCAPALPDGFDEELCIVREGEHSCPLLGGYSERTLLYTGVEDQRTCDADSCSCAVPSGSCGGQVKLHSDGNVTNPCGTTLATIQGSTSPFNSGNLCQATPATATTVSYSVDLSGRSCSASGDAGIAGESVGTGTRTLCCQPPL